MLLGLKKITAVFLCLAVCMTADTGVSAAEWNTGGSYDGAAAGEAATERAEPEEAGMESAVPGETGTESTEPEETGTESAKPGETVTEGTAPEEAGTAEESATERTEGEETGGTETSDETVETENQTGTGDEESAETETETETATETEEADGTEEDATETEDASSAPEDYEAQPGYMEDEFPAERLAHPQVQFYARESSIPAAYSAVENGQTTPVKDQARWGSCWAFAAIAAAESGYKRVTGNDVDMSETHLINFLYNDDLSGPDGGLEGDKVIPKRDKVNNGGNGMYTTFALARWTGVADEAEDQSLVYPSPEGTYSTALNIPQELAYTDIMHLQNAFWINKNDTDEIKKAVMKYGTIQMAYRDDSQYSSRNVDKSIYDGPSVYYNYNNFTGIGHAVSLVGWDDNFDRTLFKNIENNVGISKPELPENNGAWLIKNSWGTSSGDDGYFWMSYEDESISDTLFAYEYERSDNYDHIYQYDGSAGIKYEKDSAITAAAVYKSTGIQTIKAVGVGIASAQTDYTVEVYTGLSDRGEPQSGICSASVSGKTTFQGYHTIKFDDYVTVSDGDLFAVVVTLSDGRIEGAEGVGIFIDKSYNNGSGVVFVANTRPGETFLKDGDGWQDVADRGTLRIKAYTVDGSFVKPEENRTLTTEMLKEIDEQEYSSTGAVPEIELNYMDERLAEGTDYEVVLTGNDKIASRTDPDAPRAVITGIGKYKGTIETTFTIIPKKITDDMVGLPVYTYNGSTLEDIAVRDGGTVLVKGTDYQISFEGTPKAAGTYTAVITGINHYAGEVQTTVVITKAALTADMIVLPDDIEYIGSALKPEVRVMVNGTQMDAGCYTVTYKNNINAGSNAQVTVTGKGDCQGKVTKTFEIRPKDIQEAQAEVKKAVYTGKGVTPSVTVKDGKKTLKKGRDYLLDYSDNVEAYYDVMPGAPGMTAAAVPRAVITGTGNYTGCLEKTFDILPKEIPESSISVQVSGDDREGGEGHARVQVFVSGTELDCAAQPQDAGAALVTVFQAGTQTKADTIVTGGKYDVQVTLRGNYKVKGKDAALKKNIVCKKDIASLNIAFADAGTAYTYDGRAKKPKITVTDAGGNTVPASCYSIKYVNNVNAGETTPGVIVSGRKDYTGTKRLGFVIARQRLDALTITPVKDTHTYTGKAVTPAVRVKDGSRMLKAGKDYFCTYSNNTDVTYNNEGNVDYGAAITVRFSDNYTIPDTPDGSRQVKFRILPAKISAVSLSAAYYTGEKVQPGKITIKAGKLEVPQECCTITTENDIDVSSKAKLTVTALPGTNYTGSRTQGYRIQKQELKTLGLPVIPDQPWLGRPVEKIPDCAIKLDDGTILDDSQYTISVKNNNKPGTATAVFKASDDGRYKGSVSVKFRIVSASVSQAIDNDAAQTVRKPYTGSEVTLTEEELRQLAPIKGASGEYALPYTATYSRNVDAGRAAVLLEGKDYLHGRRTVYFTISPKSVSGIKIDVGSRQLSYAGGMPVYLGITGITDDGKTLRVGKDYTVSYTGAEKKGVACMAVTGTGNYTGTRRIYYSID